MNEQNENVLVSIQILQLNRSDIHRAEFYKNRFTKAGRPKVCTLACKEVLPIATVQCMNKKYQWFKE